MLRFFCYYVTSCLWIKLPLKFHRRHRSKARPSFLLLLQAIWVLFSSHSSSMCDNLTATTVNSVFVCLSMCVRQVGGGGILQFSAPSVMFLNFGCFFCLVLCKSCSPHSWAESQDTTSNQPQDECIWVRVTAQHSWPTLVFVALIQSGLIREQCLVTLVRMQCHWWMHMKQINGTVMKKWVWVELADLFVFTDARIDLQANHLFIYLFHKTAQTLNKTNKDEETEYWKQWVE